MPDGPDPEINSPGDTGPDTGLDQAPTAEPNQKVTSQDILKASDSAAALAAYHAARKERFGGDQPADLMTAMGERLLQLGETGPAMQWTLAGEQTRNTENNRRTTEELNAVVRDFGRHGNNVGETVSSFGNFQRKLDETMQDAASRLSRAAGQMSEAADRMTRPRY